MEIILVDIDQFNVININITTSNGAGLGQKYLLFMLVHNEICHIPNEVYNITNMKRLNIYWVLIKGISKKIQNLCKLSAFYFEFNNIDVNGKSIEIPTVIYHTSPHVPKCAPYSLLSRDIKSKYFY